MKMESASTTTALDLITSDDSNNKSNETSLLPSENNNTEAAALDSVAMATSKSPVEQQQQPEDDATAAQEQELSSAVNVRETSTDDDSSQCDVINRANDDAEGSEVTRDDCALEKDGDPQEGASGTDEAGDLKVDEHTSGDLVMNETEELATQGVEEEQCQHKLEEDGDNSSVGDKEDESVEKQGDEDKIDAVDEQIGAAVVAEDDSEDIKVEREIEENDAKETDESWNKMHLTEDVSEGNQVQPASPGHHASASSSPSHTLATNVTPAVNNKALQQNGVASSKDTTKAATVDNTTREEDTGKMSTRTDVVTNGNDHTSGMNDDDEEFANSNKTERSVFESKSPDYIQASEEPTNAPKRRMSQSSGTDQLTAGQSNSKRMKISTLENHDFQTRDQILNSYMENIECTSFDGLKKHSDQLLLEIHKLGEVAKVKEREWNQILHQKKLREELLLRLQRAKQIMVLQTNGNTNPKHQDQLLQRYQQQQQNQRQQQVYQQQQDLSGLTDKGRQGPLVDVQKMISDYRQTHPESIPRRGRRIRGQDGQQRSEGSNLLTFSNVALGSGSQVRTSNSGSGNVASINQDIYNEFSLLLSSMDNDRLKTASSSSIKELLAQFARMSPSERQDLLNSVKGPHNVSGGQATNYPEVTVHAVQQQQAAALATPSASNSLLHGILTKPTKSPSTSKDTTGAKQQQSFSPTLARLLTAPEQRTTTTTSTGSNQQQHKASTHSLNHHKSNNASSSSSSSSSSTTATTHLNNNRHQSLSDLILSSTKARNEITITPVQQYEEHSKSSIHQQEEEADDSADRLVIDEGDSHVSRHKQVDEEVAEEVPQCQGCNHKAAQFVCAGCGNQWYCSRECQVAAWDEHSEVCSG